MSNRVSEQAALDFLRTQDHYIIFTHNAPDGDTVGSAIALVAALRFLGKSAWAYNREGVPDRLSFLCPEAYFLAELPRDFAKYTLISVDVASPKMLSMPEAGFVFALAIDHHQINTIGCERLYLCDSYIAAGEIVYELIKKLDVPMTAELALPLYAAISSDSGGFRYQATRPETMYAAGELMATGIDFARINRLLFENKTPTQISLEKLAYQKLAFFFDGRFALVTVTAEEMASIGATDGDTEVLNQIPRQVSGVQVSAVIKPKGEWIKCSLRSNEDIDVASLAKAWNGGGHFHAAGFSMKNVTVEQVKNLLLGEIEGLLL